MKPTVVIASLAILPFGLLSATSTVRADVVQPASSAGHASIVDDADSGWTWSSMAAYSDIGLAKGSGHAGGPGAYGVYTFNGTGVDIFVMRGSTVNIDGRTHRIGKLKVSIDGHEKAEVALSAAAADYNVSAFNVSGLPSKLHVLEIEPESGWAIIDYIKVSSDDDPADSPATAGTSTGEAGDPGLLFSSKLAQLYGVNTIEGRNNVSGFNENITPELQMGILPDDWGLSVINAHSGNTAIRYSGSSTGPAAYCYMLAYSVKIAVSSNTSLSYWIYPQQDNGRFVAVDLHCTDGTTLSQTAAVDQDGVAVAPAHGHGGAIPTGAWTNSRCHIGEWLAGKTIDKIWIGYARQNSNGQYRGYIDDLFIGNEQTQGK